MNISTRWLQYPKYIELTVTIDNAVFVEGPLMPKEARHLAKVLMSAASDLMEAEE